MLAAIGVLAVPAARAQQQEQLPKSRGDRDLAACPGRGHSGRDPVAPSRPSDAIVLFDGKE